MSHGWLIKNPGFDHYLFEYLNKENKEVTVSCVTQDKKNPYPRGYEVEYIGELGSFIRKYKQIILL